MSTSDPSARLIGPAVASDVIAISLRDSSWPVMSSQVDVALNSRRDRHIADRGTKGPVSTMTALYTKQ